VNRITPVVLVAAVAAAAALATSLLASRHDPGATVDSGEYLAVAEAVADGHGFTMPYVSYDEPYRLLREADDRVPMTQFPPLYPTATAAVMEASGTSAMDATRWLNAAAFAITAALAVVTVRVATGSTAWAAAAGVLMINPDFVFLSAMAWSEQLMVALLAGAVLALSLRQRSGRLAPLAIAALCAVLASLTRYVGVAVLLAVAWVVYREIRGSAARRLGAAGAVVAAGLAPLVLWFARNVGAQGEASDKTLAWHPPSTNAWHNALRSVTNWVVRDNGATRKVVLVLLVALVVGAAVKGRAVWRRARRGLEERTLPALAAVTAALYLVVLLASRTVLDRNIALDSRQFAAIHLLLVVGATTAVARARPSPRRWGAAALGVVALISLFRIGADTIPRFPTFVWSGYTTEAWKESPTLARLRAVPEDVAIVTNAPDPIWLLLGREAFLLPLTTDLYTGRRNVDYRDQLLTLAAHVRRGEARLVFFDRPTRKPARQLSDAVLDAFGASIEQKLDDGTVYLIEGGSEPATGDQDR